MASFKKTIKSHLDGFHNYIFLSKTDWKKTCFYICQSTYCFGKIMHSSFSCYKIKSLRYCGIIVSRDRKTGIETKVYMWQASIRVQRVAAYLKVMKINSVFFCKKTDHDILFFSLIFPIKRNWRLKEVFLKYKLN